MHIIAIDPGVSGGIACHIGTQVQAWKMPETQTDFLMLIRSINANIFCCYVEDVPKHMGNALPASSIAVMFENYGYIKGVLQSLGIRTVLVVPRTWQKPFGLGKKDSIRAPKDAGALQKQNVQRHNDQAKRDWKNKLKAEAQRRFPGIDVTLSTCDALLILDYALMAETGRLPEPQSKTNIEQPSLLIA